jgi:hypothetical protein
MRQDEKALLFDGVQHALGDIVGLEHGPGVRTTVAPSCEAWSAASRPSFSMLVLTPMGHRQLTSMPRSP